MKNEITRSPAAPAYFVRCWHFFFPISPFAEHYCVYIIYERSFWFWSAWQLALKLVALIYWRHGRLMKCLHMASRPPLSSSYPSHQRRFCCESSKFERVNQVRRFNELFAIPLPVLSFTRVRLIWCRMVKVTNWISAAISDFNEAINEQNINYCRHKLCGLHVDSLIHQISLMYEFNLDWGLWLWQLGVQLGELQIFSIKFD